MRVLSIQNEARQQVRGVKSLSRVLEGVTGVRDYNSGDLECDGGR